MIELLHLASAVDRMFHLYETGTSEYLLRYRKLGEWEEVVAVSRAKRAERITFGTSGSTGTPKQCEHRFAALREEASVHAAAFRDRRRIVSMVPRHHIYGFIWTILLPEELGITVLDGRRLTGPQLERELRRGDLVVATPAMWARLNDSDEPFRDGVAGVTSGAACPDSIARSLAIRGIDLTEVYGSSETAGIGTRLWSDKAFYLLPYWIRENDGCLRRSNPDGSEGEAMKPPDRLEWLDSHRFRVGERIDGAVQVLGLNVFPAYVAECIQGHPAVRDCAVRLMNPNEGNRLKCYVVAEADGDLKESLTRWIRDRLEPHERPAHFTFGPELPRNEMGKPAEWDCRRG